MFSVNEPLGNNWRRKDFLIQLTCLVPWLANTLMISLKTDALACLSKEAAILDWTGLGIHTRSCIGEYGQSKPAKGKPYATVPNNKGAGEWAGTPLAFIHNDFEFCDKLMICWPYMDCLEEPRLAQFLHVCFCYHRSKYNFSIHKFKWLLGKALCVETQLIQLRFPRGSQRTLTNDNN